jgi:hypothetical protein
MNRNIAEAKYFTVSEVEQFKFFRIPKALLNKKYKNLSLGAKFLYGLLFDRTMLSKENDWIDDEGRVFIYYSRETAMEEMCIGKNKAISLFKELVKYNLIEEIRQGLGRVNIIYVLKYILNEEVERKPVSTENTARFKNQTSSISKNKLHQVQKINPNNTKENYTEFIKTTTTSEKNIPTETEKTVSEVHGTEKASKIDTNNSTSVKKSESNKIQEVTPSQIKTIQNKFMDTLSIYLEEGTSKDTLFINDKTMKKLIENNGLDKINEYLNNHHTFTIKKNPTGFMIKAINENWKGTKIKTPVYASASKPTQSSNFDQREYSDEFFDSLYDNF